MKNKKRLFARAGFAFLCCIACCAFTNYLAFTVVHPCDSDSVLLQLFHFSVYTAQVFSAVFAVVYGNQLVLNGRFLDDWYNADMQPDIISCVSNAPVVFVTVDGCLFNGFYDEERQLFIGKDGLSFNADEIAGWTLDSVEVHNGKVCVKG